MAPIRRYLRITKYSVLECRIYLHNPADTHWLLNSKDKVLSQIFERIRPHVLPKLREENERVRAKKKSNPLKDVISEGQSEIQYRLLFPYPFLMLPSQQTNTRYRYFSRKQVHAILS